jgi:hypothetical protein
MPLSKALVPVAKAQPEAEQAAAHPGAVRRANADFVAHLIATSAQAPQTRARRRAEPVEAIAAYGALGHWPTLSGKVLSRSL